MMNRPFFTIIIKKTTSVTAIDALFKQSFSDWECIIANNNIENIEQYIANDSRFKILPHQSDDIYENVNRAIEVCNGKYFIIINSDDVFTPKSLTDISRMATLTDAEIIKYETMTVQSVSGVEMDEQQYTFNYIIRKKIILESAFGNLSGFCFKNHIMQSEKIHSPEHIFILNKLIEAHAITRTNQIYVLSLKNIDNTTSDDYVNIVKNYISHADNIDDAFWKKYFYSIMPKLIITMVTNHERDKFIYVCHNVPLRFIPHRYRFMIFLLKITHKKI